MVSTNGIIEQLCPTVGAGTYYMRDKNEAKHERTFIITSGLFQVNSNFRAYNTRVHAYFNAVMHSSAQTKLTRREREQGWRAMIFLLISYIYIFSFLSWLSEKSQE